MSCYKDQKNTMKIIKIKKNNQRIGFQNMSIEERDKLNEYHRTWYSKLDDDKKNKMRRDALDRYYSLKVCLSMYVLFLNLH